MAFSCSGCDFDGDDSDKDDINDNYTVTRMLTLMFKALGYNAKERMAKMDGLTLSPHMLL